MLAETTWEPSVLDAVSVVAQLGPVLEQRRFNAGSSHAVYRLRTPGGFFAVRIGGANDRSHGWLKDARLSALHLAPQVLSEGTVASGGKVWSYVVSEWLEGRPLDYRRDLRRLAATLAILHRGTVGYRLAPVSAPDLSGYLKTQLLAFARQRAAGGAIGELLGRAAENGLSALSGSPQPAEEFQCLVHNDLVRQNLVIVSGRAHLIDWDWAMNASPVLDLCGFLSPFVTSWDSENILGDHAVMFFLDNYLNFHQSTDACQIRRGVSYSWTSYNAAVANWVYANSDASRPHLHDIGFYRRGFAWSEAIHERLQKSIRD